MNSKLRVKMALNHEEPDRVPASFSAAPWVVERLKDYLNVQTDRDLLEALHTDVFDMRGIDHRGAVSPRYIGPDDLGIPMDWNGDVLALFGYRETIVETDYGKMYSQGEANLSETRDIEDLRNHPWPTPDWFDYSMVREQLEEWSDFAIACTGCSVFQHPTFLRGMDKLLMDMAVAPEMAEFVFDKFTDFYYEYYRRIFENAGDLIDIFRIADDLGTQNSLLISPRMIERFFAPRLKRFTDLAKEHDIKVLLHSDGSIRQIIPRLIELGVDILDPIQPEAKDMNPAEIKREFGDRLCLQGGISVQDVLSKGMVQDVKEEVKRRIDQLAPGGGYILSPGHPVLQVDVPVENIAAMYETGFEYGRY
ncbi:MAG TPA: hypothetical protein DCP08_09090 [Chloroflexi bacterium]|nr:hypothetical protein [Chloroflexota bacterium]